MADISDYLEASRQTDAALQLVSDYGAHVEDTRHHLSPEGASLTIMVGLGLRAVALAIRESATRADYVTRDEARRG